MLLDTLNKFIVKKKIPVEEDFVESIKEAKDIAEQNYEKHGDSKKTKGAGRGSKQVPYPSEDTHKKKKSLRARPYQRLKNIPPKTQKEDMEKLWQEMNEKKMDIEDGSKWYIVSAEWFSHWKQWTGFSEKIKMDDDIATVVSSLIPSYFHG